MTTLAPIAQPIDRTRLAWGGRWALVAALVGGFVVGGVTACAQSWLPFSTAPLANSAGTWVLIAFCLALLPRRALLAAGSGAVGLGALLAGYVTVNDALRGYSSSTSMMLFWGAAAVLIGPVLGLAAHALRRGTELAAAGGLAVVVGVLVGEGVSSLWRVADTTSVAYWWSELAAGVVLLLVVGLNRLSPRGFATAVVSAAAVAGVVVLAYGCGPAVLSAL